MSTPVQPARSTPSSTAPSSPTHDVGTVAVLGGGPAGLALARLLQVRGVAVSVYERDSSAGARRQGGSLDLRPDSGQRAIRAAGLEGVFARSSREEAKEFRLVTSDGVEVPGAGEETHEDAGPEIDRGELRRLLLQSLCPGTVRWDHRVRDVVRTAEGRWRVEFAGQPPVEANLVVGADGIGSRVRRRLTDVTPVYTGHTMLAATLPRSSWRGSEISDVVGEGSVMFAGGEKTVFVQRCADDLILTYFSLRVPQGWPTTGGREPDAEGILAEVAEAYRDWSPDLMSMLLDVDRDTLQPWPLSVMPPEHRWASQPGLTMIGDAAHVMPPFTGKGVNLTLLDALELAEALTGPRRHPADPSDDPADDSARFRHEAVAAFERGMQERTRTEISACLDVGRDFYGIDLTFPRGSVA
jgi:2-polyprenyl-6-methoxyphenol hydroxylase-like FAD-dependent oxidoreductase